MQPDTLDRDFLRFQRTREPDALAAVFDAAAPRLLLVAMHLCRDAAAAEDLVQTVFLQALRDVDRFDARRPVMPWLLTILEHRASDHRGRAHRRREQAGNGAGMDDVPGQAPSPERQAIAAEVRQRLAEALAGMPRDYRDVLTLRLVHGLSPVDIAHAHGVPPATVRTRLRRGLELLRGALPRGLATPGLLALLGAELLRARDGLTAVRVNVLAAAAVGTGAAFGIGFWGLLAACLLSAFGGWFWWLGHEAPMPPAAEPGVAAVTALRADDGRSSEPTSAPAPAAERVAAAAARDPRSTTLSGRVVDADNGAPLPRAVVHLRAYSDGGREGAPEDWRDPEPVRAEEDGRFAIVLVPPPALHIELAFETGAHVKQWRSFAPLREGVRIELGDVALLPGTPVRLRLLAGDEPLGGVELFAAHSADGAQPNGMYGCGPSDRDGVVDLGVRAPGTWYYEVQTAHDGNTGRIAVPRQPSAFEAVVTLREPPRERSISGVLFEKNGLPVSGVRLAIRAPGGGYHCTTTCLDGRFLWSVAAPAASGPVRIELLGDRPELEWMHDGGVIAWGAHDLRLVVRRRNPATLRLEVVAADSGQVVEAFGATCWRDPWAPGAHCDPDLKRGALAPRPGGVATFVDLAPGAWFVSVFPPPPWAENAEIPVLLAEGASRTLRVELSRPVALAVAVTAAGTGAPMPGVEVALAKVVPEERRSQVEIGAYRCEVERARRGVGYSSAQNTLVIARATSDANGAATLFAPPDLPGLVLYAEGPRCIAALRHDLELPRGGAATSIAVVPAARVHGVLGPREFLTRCGPSAALLAAAAERAKTEWPDPEAFAEDWPKVELRGVDAQARFGAYVAADGSFAIGGVPAGRYEVWIEASGYEDDGRPAWTSAIGPLTTVDLKPGPASTPLPLDASPFLPARVSLRLFVDGAPWCGGAGLHMVSVDEGLEVDLAASADGTATSPWLRPGTWLPFVELVGTHGERRPIVSVEPLVVVPGRDLQASVHLQHRRVLLTVHDAAGEPVRDRWLRVEPVDTVAIRRVAPMRTDADGRVVLDPAAPGRLRVRAFAASWIPGSDAEPEHDLGEVAATAAAATFVLH